MRIERADVSVGELYTASSNTFSVSSDSSGVGCFDPIFDDEATEAGTESNDEVSIEPFSVVGANDAVVDPMTFHDFLNTVDSIQSNRPTCLFCSMDLTNENSAGLQSRIS